MTEAYLNAVLPSKLRLDQLYVRNHSLLLDLDILFWTGIVFLQRLERVQPDEQDLFVGPISNLFRRYLNWFALDTLVTLVAMGLTGLIWRSMGPLNVGWLRSIAMALAFAVLFSLSGAALGTPRIDWSRAAWSDIFDLILPAGLATGLALLGNWWLGGQAPLFPPAMVLVASFLALLGFILVRYRGQLLWSAGSALVESARQGTRRTGAGVNHRRWTDRAICCLGVGQWRWGERLSGGWFRG